MSEGEPATETAETAEDRGTAATADRVVVSYDESALDERLRPWVARELGRASYRRYLARAHDAAAEGDEWDEFVSRGCGAPADVRLRVERVDGGPRLDADTVLEVRAR